MTWGGGAMRYSFDDMTIEERYQLFERLICVLEKIRKQALNDGDSQLCVSIEEIYRAIREELPLLVESDGGAAGKILEKATELVVAVYTGDRHLVDPTIH